VTGPTFRRRELLALLAAAPLPAPLGAPLGAPLAAAGAPGDLRRGINLTNWFRYPVSADPAALAAHMPDAAMARLRQAGFDFVRLAVQPGFLLADLLRIDLLVASVRWLHGHGLAVIVDAHPEDWHLETSAADRAALLGFWDRLAPRLAPLDTRMTVIEVLNEPVFAADPAGWAALQREALALIRHHLPGHRVLLTGNDWGSVNGLLATDPVDDPQVLYSIHFYDPSELTSLAAYRPGLDRAALARLPFPMTQDACAPAERTADQPTRALIRYVCALGWDTARIAARLDAAAAWGARHRVRVLMGEFGASRRLNVPARLAWLAAVRQGCERNGMGWALWGYEDDMGFGIRTGAPPLDPAVLRALGM
jgi:hypothetical protein